MNKHMTLFGSGLIALGIGMMFFAQTEPGAWIIMGAGLGLLMAGLTSPSPKKKKEEP